MFNMSDILWQPRNLNCQYMYLEAVEKQKMWQKYKTPFYTNNTNNDKNICFKWILNFDLIFIGWSKAIIVDVNTINSYLVVICY